MKALLVIDMQREYSAKGALPVAHLDIVSENVKKLMGIARKGEQSMLVHVRHVSRTPGDSSFDAGSSGIAFMDGFEPQNGEPVVTKIYPGAFSNPQLDRILVRANVETVAICGLTSFLCCDSTAREAFQLGYKVYYVDDAISEFSLTEMSGDDLHEAVRVVQGAMYSTVVDTEEALQVLA